MPAVPTKAELAQTPTALTKKEPAAQHDMVREVFETIVFVVVLVLMLKLFVAEAFVIPTGSMASTLWGDQIVVTCRECGHRFPVNAQNDGAPKFPNRYVCENCGNTVENELVAKDSTSINSGDRVLVSKYAYHIGDPQRFQVPVFKYPREPFKSSEFTSMNYIKRLVGLGGETIAVFNGDLYVTRDLNYDHIPDAERPHKDTEARWARYMYEDDPVATDYFRKGKFEIVRKSPQEIMAVRRLIFDLDQQPKSLQGVRRTRWHPTPKEDAGWQMEGAGFKHSGPEPGWVRYQHINPWDSETVTPYLIDDFLAYNCNTSGIMQFSSSPGDHWVSDLVLDCTVEVPSADSQVTLELAKGRNRYQAIFGGGQCKLVRIETTEAGQDQTTEMGSHATKITKGGKYDLRFANFDARLTVWVDDTPVPFAKEQTDYPPPSPLKALVPYDPHDKEQPARVGAQGDVTVSKVSLWRDLHYRCGENVAPPSEATGKTEAERLENQRQIEQAKLEWNKNYPVCSDLQTYYIQPGHYMMFGDNVNSSSDSRYWGTVPQRLMLGRAIVIYWPSWPYQMRVGLIE